MDKCTCNYCHKNPEHIQKCNCSSQFQPCQCPFILFNKKLNPKAKNKRRSKPKCIKCIKSDDKKIIPKISIRLEQLAIRPVRYLACTRDEHIQVIPKIWYNRFNRQICKSENTLFHKLAKSIFHIPRCRQQTK